MCDSKLPGIKSGKRFGEHSRVKYRLLNRMRGEDLVVGTDPFI